MFKFGFFNPNDYVAKNQYPYVTSPEIFLKGKQVFDPNGLFSEVIWPHSENARFEKKAVIDLRKSGKFIHPKFLSILKSHQKSIFAAVTGTQPIIVEKGEIKKSTNKSGFLGPYVIKFLVDNLQNLKNINPIIAQLLQKWKLKVFIDSIFVLPPALRDIIVKDGTIISKPVINTYYQQLIRLSQNTSYSFEYLMSLENAPISSITNWYKIQNLIYKIYLTELEALKKKEGFIRQNVLGKRVDFSARAVASVDPSLPHDTIAVPYKIGAKLFEPFIAHYIFSNDEIQKKLQNILKRPITENTFANEMKLYRDGLYPSEASAIIETILDTYIAKKYPLVMKRDPGLHRMSLQGFYCIFTKDDVIKVAPMVTEGFNLDFDGDQLALYVPLTVEAQREVKERMIGSYINPGRGHLGYTPSQDIVLGIYQATKKQPSSGYANETVTDIVEVPKIFRYDLDTTVSYSGIRGKNIITTYGRYLVSMFFPSQVVGIIQEPVTKKELSNLVEETQKLLNKKEFANFLTKLTEFAGKVLLYKPVSVNLDELIIPEELKILAKKILLTEDMITAQQKIKTQVIPKLKKYLEKTNSGLLTLVESGAKGSWSDIEQLLIAKGYLADNKGDIIKKPIASAFVDGLLPQEVQQMGPAAIKGSADRSLNTQETGYLLRILSFAMSGQRLAGTKDCKTKNYLKVYVDTEKYADTLRYRYSKEFGWITDKNYKQLIGKTIHIRSPIFCTDPNGICQTCYGHYSKIMNTTEIGTLGAMSLGERGSQVMMKTFHTGGRASISKGINTNEMWNCKLVTQVKSDIIAQDDIIVKISFDEATVRYVNNIISVTGGIISVKSESSDTNCKLDFSKSDIPFGVDITQENIDKIDIVENGLEIHFSKNEVIGSIKYTTVDMSTQVKILKSYLFGHGVSTYQELYDKLKQMYGNFGLLSIHYELLISVMLRNAKDPFVQFRHRQNEPYIIMSVKTVPYYESPLVGIGFENLEKASEIAILSSSLGHEIYKKSPIERLLIADIEKDVKLTDIFR